LHNSGPSASTREQRATLLGGRRGGVSVGKAAPKVKRVLKLTDADQEAVEEHAKETGSAVPIDKWRNELAHIVMALGADDEHTQGDFPLTTMKISNPQFRETDELNGRRPENVAMDS
jgi:hypothetical protein